MKTFYILLLFLLTTIVKAQYSSIKGKITIENQSENIEVKVVIKETNKQVATDKKGNFEISELTAGTYTIVFSAFGYQEQQKIIFAKENENQIINIFLKENINALQTVEITGRKEKSYKNTKSFIGAKTEIALKDLPQSVSYATKELIADQGAIRVGEVVKNFSGVSQFSFYDDISIRGFRINGQSNTQLLNGLRTSTGFWKQPLAII